MGIMPAPTIAIPAVSHDEVEELTRLRQNARRVHKSIPAHSPVRESSAQLNEYLCRLHRRGVPLKVLAHLVGLSHQAIRVRVRAALPTSPPAPSPLVASGAPSAPSPPTKVGTPPPGVVLVSDAGVHRRLLIYDPPTDLGAAQLAMMPRIPFLTNRDQVNAWLETTSSSTRSNASATPLRTPPAVYVTREVSQTVLQPLNPETETGPDPES